MKQLFVSGLLLLSIGFVFLKLAPLWNTYKAEERMLIVAIYLLVSGGMLLLLAGSWRLIEWGFFGGSFCN